MALKEDPEIVNSPPFMDTVKLHMQQFPLEKT